MSGEGLWSGNPGFWGTGDSEPVTPTAPVVTANPTITGTPQVGVPLALTNGSATGVPSPTASTRTIRNAAGDALIATLSPGDTTWTPAVGQVGLSVYLRVVWTNGTSPDATGNSTPIGPIVSADVAPSVTANPTLTGTPQVGVALTFGNGTASGTPTPAIIERTIRNAADNTIIATLNPGDTTWVPGLGQQGLSVYPRVVWENTAGTATGNGASVGPIAAAAAAPAVITNPSLTGTPQEGVALTFNNGSASGSPSPTFVRTIRNAADDSLIATLSPGDTTYTPGAAQVGLNIYPRVVWTNSEGSATGNGTAVGPVAAATGQPSFTDRSVTFNFATPVQVGTYPDGTGWAVGATVTSIDPVGQSGVSGGYSNSPATYTGRIINGSMIATDLPTSSGLSITTNFHGWDNIFELIPSATSIGDYNYSASLNADPSITGNPISGSNICIAKFVSRPVPEVAARNAALQLTYLDILSSAPPAGAFRRWPGSTDKTTLFTTADLDFTVLPLFPTPAGASLPTFQAVLDTIGPIQTFFTNNLLGRGMNPTSQMEVYGGDIADDLCLAITYTMMQDVPIANRQEVARRLVQAGLDVVGANQGSRRWSVQSTSNGGGQHYVKALVLYAARLLRNASNTAALNGVLEWLDRQQRFVFAEDRMCIQVTRDRIENLSNTPVAKRITATGYLNWMENTIDWRSKPSSLSDQSHSFDDAYRNTTGYPMMATALFARIMGAETLWNNTLYFDYCDRFYNWWSVRGFPSDSRFEELTRRFVLAHFVTYSPSYAAGSAPTRVRAEARERDIWFEYAENLDMASVPASTAFEVRVNGSPVTLTTITRNANGQQTDADDNINTQTPIITGLSTTADLYPGMRVTNAALTGDVYIAAILSANSIQIDSLVPVGFSGLATTFSPVRVWGRSLSVVLPAALNPGDTVTLQYTQPGTNRARSLRGVSGEIASTTAITCTNRTGQLPQAATTKDVVYGGAVQAERQLMSTQLPRADIFRRFIMGLRFKLKGPIAGGDNYVCNQTASGTNFRLYAATLYQTVEGVGASFRIPSVLTSLPLETDLTMFVVIDLTGTTPATCYRGRICWNGGSVNLVDSGGSSPATGTDTLRLSTMFSGGLHLGGTTNAVPINAQANVAFREFAMLYGDNTLSLPTLSDLQTLPQYQWDADWGGNGQSVFGAQPQLYYAGTLDEANGGWINRGNYGSLGMGLRRVDGDGDPTSFFVLG